MVNVLCDTSILIDFSRTAEGIFSHLMKLAATDQVVLMTSSIVIYEFWQGSSMQKKENQQIARALFKNFEVVSINQEVAELAGLLSSKKIVTGMDCLIAASALVSEAQLATLNVKHFRTVPGLKLFEIAE